MEEPSANWYTINNVSVLDTPALVVYPDRVKQNLSLLKTMIDDVARLRPHIKTHKNLDAVLLTISAGINKFKCATIAEAELLGTALAADVLLAYQPEGPKLIRFIKLIKAFPGTRFSCLTDNNYSANKIAAAAVEHGLQIPVYIDINAGMNRTGILPNDDALKLYTDCNALKGIMPVGLHVYDGHIHDHDLQVRENRCNAYFEKVLQLRDNIIAKGLTAPVIIAGGTPTFPIHAKRENIECSPGTFIYWDRGYQLAFAEQQFLTAALVITRVISIPSKTTLCLDAGHKSIAAESELNKRIYFLNAPQLTMVSQSEEHLVVDAGENHPYKIGDVLYGLPYHICPTVALYERAVTVLDNKITGEWMNKARDRKINI